MKSEERSRDFRLFGGERLVWFGVPDTTVSRPLSHLLGAIALGSVGAVMAFFAELVREHNVTEHAAQGYAVAAIFVLMGIALYCAPLWLRDSCEFAITDRRVLWRRGRYVRSLDREALTYTRLVWNRTSACVGDIEFTRAVPFGPLLRKQRIVFHDLRNPGDVLALVRGARGADGANDRDLTLSERLDHEEQVVWGGASERWVPGWRELFTAVIGIVLLLGAAAYGIRIATVLLDLEHVGLRIFSPTWLLLFAGGLTTTALLFSVGLGLLWYATARSRALAADTEYIITDRRVLVRRGAVELSVDRRRIVDAIEERRPFGLTNLYLVLDAPNAPVLADSGALSAFAPSRDSVPPVLYEIRDVGVVRSQLLPGVRS